MFSNIVFDAITDDALRAFVEHLTVTDYEGDCDTVFVEIVGFVADCPVPFCLISVLSHTEYTL